MRAGLLSNLHDVWEEKRICKVRLCHPKLGCTVLIFPETLHCTNLGVMWISRKKYLLWCCPHCSLFSQQWQSKQYSFGLIDPELQVHGSQFGGSASTSVRNCASFWLSVFRVSAELSSRDRRNQTAISTSQVSEYLGWGGRRLHIPLRSLETIGCCPIGTPSTLLLVIDTAERIVLIVLCWTPYLIKGCQKI